MKPIEVPKPVVDALDGSRNQDQQLIADTALELLTTLLAKNSDYGSSVFKRPRLCPRLSPGEAILVRASDKLERLDKLSEQPAEVVGESWEDTLQDLGGYIILYFTNKKRQALGLQPLQSLAASDFPTLARTATMR